MCGVLVRESLDHRDLGEVSPHFYSFGGFSATARWASDIASGTRPHPSF